MRPMLIRAFIVSAITTPMPVKSPTATRRHQIVASSRQPPIGFVTMGDLTSRPVLVHDRHRLEETQTIIKSVTDSCAADQLERPLSDIRFPSTTSFFLFSAGADARGVPLR
jgi:hypothetical protein